ncbi:MAG: peptide chain release factor N(5)-glutamine methyltransferase [Deltaproteobacteria bacterium]|nr:peptide chain release factor N(5)-glutamine methyltransferase [Deltaproteobacteria bacterium]
MDAAEALDWAKETLKKNKAPDPEVEAEFLLSHVLDCKRHELYLSPRRVLSGDEEARLRSYMEKRARREPAQYIVGEAEFRGLRFKVTRATLIPRPETELLVDEALDAAGRLKAESLTAVDLCTGSGCIAVSLAKELARSIVYATDISEAALDVARENARANGVADRVRFLQGDLFGPLSGLGVEGRAGLIISNPPYVSKKDMEDLAPEIKDYEPEAALYGGEDGLDFYRKIIAGSPAYLAPGGYLIMELGYGQAAEVKGLVSKTGAFTGPEIRKDYSGIDRVLKARLKG